MVIATIYRGYSIGGQTKMEFETVEKAINWFENNSYKISNFDIEDLSFMWFEENNFEATPVTLKNKS